jgi:hypothetical protein
MRATKLLCKLHYLGECLRSIPVPEKLANLDAAVELQISPSEK